MGRVLESFEPWLTGEMLEHTPFIDASNFGSLTRQRYHIYVIENEGGPRALATYQLPDIVPSVVLGGRFWVRPDLRGTGTLLLNALIKEVLATSGRTMMVTQAAPGLLDKKQEYVTPLRAEVDQIYVHQGVFVYVPS